MGLFSRRQEPGDAEPAVVEAEEELARLQRAAEAAGVPEGVRDVLTRELERLARIDPALAEYSIGCNYVDYLVHLPWQRTTSDNLDLEQAKALLDREHYGLAEVKERILEFLAVRVLRATAAGRVLVVDDDPVARRNLAHVLGRQGYQVVVAASGAEAMALLEREAMDVVVTDLKMEAVDGMQILDRARQRDPEVAVIMISGFADTPVAVEAMRRGSFHFLAKPLDLDELRRAVAAAMERRTARLDPSGPILCFLGPPGTGKTSLCRSIASCLGRRFVRISLAGMKDEAQIRGHRRSYVGALPGRLIQEIHRAGVRNPVVMLDEIDKLGQDGKGDPAAALLEVLDPGQNRHFLDLYLDVPFDLSQVMFIATANTLDTVPPPLRDRLEVLSFSGYTDEEKEHIAREHLVVREVAAAGLAAAPPRFTDGALRTLINCYTREAGVRELQRRIAAICRKLARRRLRQEGGPAPVVVDENLVAELLGPPLCRPQAAPTDDRLGVAAALALGEGGGQLVFVEAAIMPGRERLVATGSLGEVMQESVQAALSYLRANAGGFGLAPDFFSGRDVHVHVPAGAVAKDGPSAGLAILAALLSLLLQRPVRGDVALSGELTLSGRVLAVGGAKAKVLAAHRAGVRRVVLPAANRDELAQVVAAVAGETEVRFVDDGAQVAALALRPPAEEG